MSKYRCMDDRASHIFHRPGTSFLKGFLIEYAPGAGFIQADRGLCLIFGGLRSFEAGTRFDMGHA